MKALAICASLIIGLMPGGAMGQGAQPPAGPPPGAQNKGPPPPVGQGGGPEMVAQRKQHDLDRVQAQMAILQTMAKCVQAAQTHDALHECHEQERTAMEATRPKTPPPGQAR